MPIRPVAPGPEAETIAARRLAASRRGAVPARRAAASSLAAAAASSRRRRRRPAGRRRSRTAGQGRRLPPGLSPLVQQHERGAHAGHRRDEQGEAAEDRHERHQAEEHRAGDGRRDRVLAVARRRRQHQPPEQLGDAHETEQQRQRHGDQAQRHGHDQPDDGDGEDDEQHGRDHEAHEAPAERRPEPQAGPVRRPGARAAGRAPTRRGRRSAGTGAATSPRRRRSAAQRTLERMAGTTPPRWNAGHLGGLAPHGGARLDREMAADDHDARRLRRLVGADHGGRFDRGVAADHDHAASDRAADHRVAVDHDDALYRAALGQRVVLKAHDRRTVAAGGRGGRYGRAEQRPPRSSAKASPAVSAIVRSKRRARLMAVPPRRVGCLAGGFSGRVLVGCRVGFRGRSVQRRPLAPRRSRELRRRRRGRSWPIGRGSGRGGRLGAAAAARGLAGCSGRGGCGA